MINNPIGIFDSGVGGLSVLKKLLEKLPDEEYIYFGDTARVPYGDKSKEELILFARQILDWFASKKVKAVLMACNTSSAVALDLVKDAYDFPVFGLIEPTAKYISGFSCDSVGVIATSATVNSSAYSNAINKLSANKKISEIACPGLVELVESNQVNSFMSEELLKKYLGSFENNIDTLILGCTHYPFLYSGISKILGKEVNLIDPADFMVAEAVKYIAPSKIKKQNVQFFVSGNCEEFENAAKLFLPTIKDIKQQIL